MSVENVMDTIKPNPPQFPLFREYAVAMKSMFNQLLYLKRFSQEKQPKIYYSTPRRAWAKYVQPIVNGASETPICTFYLNGMTPVQGETMGGFVTTYEENPENEDEYTYSFSPSLWRLNYTVTIWSKTMTDMDNMLSQILIMTMSPKTWAAKVDGAWAEFVTESVAFEDEMEPGDAVDKVYRRSVTMYVRRAYLPRESFTVGKIKQINTSLELLEDVGSNAGEYIEATSDIDLEGE